MRAPRECVPDCESDGKCGGADDGCGETCDEECPVCTQNDNVVVGMTSEAIDTAPRCFEYNVMSRCDS